MMKKQILVIILVLVLLSTTSSASTLLEGYMWNYKLPIFKQCPILAQVPGIDVSHWQGDINWAQVYNAGYRFAFVKATQRDNYLDPKFTGNINNAKNAGMLVGAYHFACPSNIPAIYCYGTSAEVEAQQFLNVAGSYLTDGYLMPVLDLEQEICNDFYPDNCLALRNWIDRWFEIIKTEKNVNPILYTSSSCINQCLLPFVNKYSLWVAHYGVTQPTTYGWNWAFWQHNSQGSVPGISGNVDLDKFNGDISELNDFVIGNSPSLTVTNPLTGYTWNHGSEVLVEWAYSGFTGNIMIHLYKGGTNPGNFVTTLTASTPVDDNEEHVNLPTSLTPGNDYIIGIAAVGTGIPSAFSDFFSIRKLTVIYPNGGQTYSPSQVVNVAWDYDTVTDNIDIHLYKGGTGSGNFVESLVASTPVNDGNENVVIPLVSSGTDYKIAISGHGGYVHDFSDNYFTINQPKPAGELCNTDVECQSQYCEGSSSYPKRCCSVSAPLDEYYCGLDEIKEFRDFYCDSSGTTKYEVTVSYDCNSLDTLKDLGNKHWVEDEICTEKEQSEKEHWDYYCKINDCEYTVTEKWVDNGNTRDKPDNTDCGVLKLCSSGTCIDIACEQKSDCGTDGYIGLAYCDNLDDVSRNYITFTCNNPITIISYCTNSTEQKLLEDCDDIKEFCEDGGCYPRIDLNIDRVDVSRVNPPTAGGLTLIRFILNNDEPNPVNNIEYTIDTGSPDTNPIYNIPDIAANTQMKTWTSWIYANSGSYSAKIILDPDDNIRETDEGNNEKTFTVDVS